MGIFLPYPSQKPRHIQTLIGPLHRKHLYQHPEQEFKKD